MSKCLKTILDTISDPYFMKVENKNLAIAALYIYCPDHVKKLKLANKAVIPIVGKLKKMEKERKLSKENLFRERTLWWLYTFTICSIIIIFCNPQTIWNVLVHVDFGNWLLTPLNQWLFASRDHYPLTNDIWIHVYKLYYGAFFHSLPFLWKQRPWKSSFIPNDAI